jgi:hypothetical protein
MNTANAESAEEGSVRTRVVMAVVALTIALLTTILTRFSTPKLDPREPPLAKSTIPFIGHIIGIIQHQSNYHKVLK